MLILKIRFLWIFACFFYFYLFGFILINMYEDIVDMSKKKSINKKK